MLHWQAAYHILCTAKQALVRIVNRESHIQVRRLRRRSQYLGTLSDMETRPIRDRDIVDDRWENRTITLKESGTTLRHIYTLWPQSKKLGEAECQLTFPPDISIGTGNQ
jgi:hypothetical protein